MAQQTCWLCNQQIGYETPFTQDHEHEGQLVHRKCVWAEEDRRRATMLRGEVR